MSEVAIRKHTSTAVRARTGTSSAPPSALTVIRAAWPLLGVGGAVASIAWLPEHNARLDAGILAAVVILGLFGLSRLVVLANK
jgi:hypothetical protein